MVPRPDCREYGGILRNLARSSTVESLTTFNEQGVKTLLLGSRDDVSNALEQIICHLRDGLCGWIRKCFPGLSPEDLADVWQDTLVSVLKAVKDGRFDAKRPLVPWLATLAYRRATDLTRRKTSSSEMLARVGQELTGTVVGECWRGFTATQRDEALQLTRKHILTLPRMQRVVLQVFSDRYPETARMEVLRTEVARVLGDEVTIATVKRALQEGRRKLRECFQRRGYETP